MTDKTQEQIIAETLARMRERALAAGQAQVPPVPTVVADRIADAVVKKQIEAIPGGTMTTTTLTSPEPKAGYKTTEFWISIIQQAIGTVLIIFGLSRSNDMLVGLGTALGGSSTVAYSYSRATAKKPAPPA